MKIIIVVLLSLLIVDVIPAYGQQTSRYNDPQSAFRDAVELFNKEKYGAARKIFDEVMEQTKGTASSLHVSSVYYDALCAYYMNNGDAEYLLLRFANKYPEHTRSNNIYFYLGADAFRNRKYNAASGYFERVDLANLSSAQLEEYHFKAGYAGFKASRLKEAKGHFLKVKQMAGTYATPAGYFYGHIAYTEGNYETALQEFRGIANDPLFSAIVPYYIFQILFFQEKYHDVIAYGPALVEDASDKRGAEVARILAESYYRTSQYEKALDYFEKTETMPGSRLSRNDHYQLGFAHYKTSGFADAIPRFQQVTGPQDTLSQYAFYYLAGCYLKTGEKQYASNAFLSSHKLAFDKEISEDALFNHAQLAYELSFDPYNEAVNALKQYLAAYPNSSRNDEAYSFLFNIALATKNYGEALTALENIRNKKPDHELNLQKIRYYHGIEMFRQGKHALATNLFSLVSESRANPKIAALSLFWKGEALYMQGKAEEAKEAFTAFLRKPGAYGQPEYNLAHYNLGYILFNNEQYDEAILSFRKFINANDPGYTPLRSDAFLRIADAGYVLSRFDDAIEWYDKAITLKQDDVDYAMYQKAICQGVLLRFSDKTETLNRMISAYPQSPMITDAMYELGNTWLQLQENEKALLSYKKITDDYPGSSFVAPSMLKTGLIYYNNGQNDLAISTFKNVVSKYPATPESKEALVSLRNIYVDLNRVDEFFRYVQNLSFADISTAEQDSITYIAAENQYLNNSCQSAIGAFSGYLSKYPEGSYRAPAYFYMAECYEKTGQADLALESYSEVISLPRSKHTEPSLLIAAKMLFQKKRYDDAFGMFYELEQTAESKPNLVEARYGQMKCNYMLQKYDQSVASATRLIATEKISNERKIDALIIRANSYIAIDDTEKAADDFRSIISMTQGAAAAEAKYNLARIEYIKQNLKQAEKEVFELINNYPSFDYWVASGFILLADIYVQTGNTFQAKQTLQSIINNFEGPELAGLAKEKLEAIHRSEEIQQPEQPEVNEEDTPDEVIEILINNEEQKDN